MIKFSSNPIDGLKVFNVEVSWHTHNTNVEPAVQGEAAYISEETGRSLGIVSTSGFTSPEVLKLARELVHAVERELSEHIGATEDVSNEVAKEKIQGLVRDI